MDMLAVALTNKVRLPIRNLVVNGNFAQNNGTIGTGWGTGNNITDVAIVDGFQQFTGAGNLSASFHNWFRQSGIFPENDHIYYVSITAKRADGLSGGGIQCGSGYNDFLGRPQLTGDWVRYSGTGERHASSWGHSFAIGATSGVTVLVTNALALDLTAIFGAGNEPTAQEMDALLAQFEGGWFNGMQYLFNPGHVLGYLLREIRDLKSAVVSLGGGV